MNIPVGLKSWQQAMKKTTQGLSIIQNLLKEDNVQDRSIIKDVFNYLKDNYTTNQDPIEQFCLALKAVPKSAKAGHKARIDIGTLTRFIRLARIPDQPEARRRGWNYRKLRSKPGRLKKLTPFILKDKERNIIWAALHEPVRKDLKRRLAIESVIDRLGMFYKPPIVQVTYATLDPPPPLRVPTAFDAG